MQRKQSNNNIKNVHFTFVSYDGTTGKLIEGQIWYVAKLKHVASYASLHHCQLKYGIDLILMVNAMNCFLFIDVMLIEWANGIDYIMISRLMCSS